MCENQLSQAEIDSLLSGDFGLEETILDSIESIEQYLGKNHRDSINYRGMFTKESHVISFFSDTNSGSVLSEIKNKNKVQGIAPIEIGGLTLTNYSYCPNCKLSYSWVELNNYYSKPFIPEGYKSIDILRKDTRVRCSSCNTFFVPSLLIETDKPRSEVQYLCRIQLIEAIEQYISKPVLTQVKANMVFERGSKRLKGIIQDVTLSDLQEDRNILVNLLQYTPYDQFLRMIKNDYKDMYILGGFLG